VVDENFALKGLITVKDIQKKLKYPNAAKDAQGRLRVAAAIGATGDFLERAQELFRKKVDVIAIDSAHGHSQRVIDALKAVKHLCRTLRCSSVMSPLSRARAIWLLSARAASKWASVPARFALRAW
jgi:hypothetical protein